MRAHEPYSSAFRTGTNYNLQDSPPMRDPNFWKGLKVGDVVFGRPVNTAGKDMKCCGLPLLDDLMSDEGRGWMVCRCWEDEGECDCGECFLCDEEE